jgi:PAS domain S-box-containing protein
VFVVSRDITDRKQIEGKLRFSEERFRSLSAASPIGIFVTDIHGQCEYTNARWQHIYGLTLTESLGDGWANTLHPEDRDGVFSHWQECSRRE